MMSSFDEFPEAPLGAESFPEPAGGSPPVAEAVKPPETPAGALIQRKAETPEEIGEAISPITGEIIQLTDPGMVAAAIDEARQFKREKLDPYINGLERVAAMMGSTVGSGTLRAGEYEITITKKRVYTRDLDAIRRELLEAGLPEERCNEVIIQTVSLSATTQDLDRLAKANEAYKQIIDRHTEVTEREPAAKVVRAKSGD